MRRFLLGVVLVLSQFSHVEPAPASEGRFRVGISGLQGQRRLDATIQSGRFRLVSQGSKKPASVFVAGQSLSVQLISKGKISVGAPGLKDIVSTLRLESASEGATVRVRGASSSRLLRGNLEFTSHGGLFLVVELPLEEYLRGVVPAEMFPSWQMEALKSQAVLARTYSLTSRSNRHEGYDVCDKSHCQAYLGVGNENERTTLAVRETAGLVVTYEGVPARIFYHSTCGGATALPGDVFHLTATAAGLPTPHAVQDRGGDTALCSVSPHFHWQFRLGRTKFQHFLHTLARQRGEPGRITKIRILERDSGGRITWLELVGPSHACKISGHEFRLRFIRSFGPDSLKSTLFSLTIEPEEVVFQGRGFGHGVGLCQWGAQALAVQGMSYRDILLHYYPKGRLERLRVNNSGD